MLNEHIIQTLLSNPNEKITGPMLAKKFGVSRNAIWKSIEQLRNQGYIISSSKENGYYIDAFPQDLDGDLLRHYLDIHKDLEIHTFDAIDSTNNESKRFALNKPEHNALFLAKQQTSGRGRYGRQFASQLAHGIYFSLKIKPKTNNPDLIPLYTLLTASAITEAMSPYLTDTIQIKWINDIFYQKRKVCGILCEALTNIETQTIESVVIGCGLNFAGEFEGVDETTKKVAGTFFGSQLPNEINLNKLIATIIERIFFYHEQLESKAFIETYRTHLLGIGKSVAYEVNGDTIEGEILDVTDEGRLLFREKSGVIKTLFNEHLHFGSDQFI